MKSFCQSLALFLIVPLLFYSLWRDVSSRYTNEEGSLDVINTFDTFDTDDNLWEYPQLSVSARAAVLMTEDGRVIYGKNENEPLEMASFSPKTMQAWSSIPFVKPIYSLSA